MNVMASSRQSVVITGGRMKLSLSGDMPRFVTHQILTLPFLEYTRNFVTVFLIKEVDIFNVGDPGAKGC